MQKQYGLRRGDCLAVMATFPAESADAFVTDPPYGLSFMGKEWDHGVPGVPYWSEVLRVLKPGGHLVAFGGTRTHHRLMVAIEDAGFEIRDCLMWLHGQGFPKGKGQLKPAWEPIILARKPLAGTVAQNVLAHGTGALNVDGCRIGTDTMTESRMSQKPGGVLNANGRDVEHGNWKQKSNDSPAEHTGRWPANVALSHGSECGETCVESCPVRLLDEQSGIRTGASSNSNKGDRPNTYGSGWQGTETLPGYADKGGASRFFYCAKAPKSERNLFLPDGMTNDHPTVKPLALMRWLARLVTPPGGLVVDPFLGSGTTGIATLQEGFRFIGIELDEHSHELAAMRLASCRESLSVAPADSAV